jgi:cysteinyl-tRNA synthetase
MRIYNSLTRKKEEFRPLKKGRVGMYVCGPTVYDEPHIGHARSAYIFDVMRRYLEYKKFKVTFVRNVTDVDDKIIEKAKTLEKAAEEVARKYLKEYHEDMALLGIRKPDKEPKATEYIPNMIKFIALLIKKDMAYEAGGDVYFDVRKKKDYGKLSNQNLAKMEIGARIAPGEGKRDGLDFALWKKAKENEPSWDSPWGKGRPGWHIECSAMSSDILGDEFDIHGGGIDLIFPHHENEIAQSEGAGKAFARLWLHNGLLTINSEKMAKSLGNFITIKAFIEKYGDPDILKLFFLSAHYRGPVDFTEEKIRGAGKEKERFLILFEKINRIMTDKSKCQILPNPKQIPNSKSKIKNLNEIEKFRKKFEKAMDDDFNTPLALASLFDLVTYANKFIYAKEEFTKEELHKVAALRDTLTYLSSVFGLSLGKGAADRGPDEATIRNMIVARDKARRKKDFKTSDRIRNELSDIGIIIEDTKDGTVWRRKV